MVRAVFVRFGLAVFAFAAPFLFPLVVAVETVDIVDMTETPLVSIESSKSGMSLKLGISDIIVSLTDWVDRRVEAFDVREDLEARPFLARGRFEGAVVPAKWKKGQCGDRL